MRLVLCGAAANSGCQSDVAFDTEAPHWDFCCNLRCEPQTECAIRFEVRDRGKRWDEVLGVASLPTADTGSLGEHWLLLGDADGRKGGMLLVTLSAMPPAISSPRPPPPPPSPSPSPPPMPPKPAAPPHLPPCTLCTNEPSEWILNQSAACEDMGRGTRVMRL